MHHVGQYSVDDALREGSVVGGHVLGKVVEAVGLRDGGSCIPGARVGGVAAIVLVKSVT